MSELFATFGAEFLAVFVLTLAIGLAISSYMSELRESARRTDLSISKRATRRLAA